MENTGNLESLEKQVSKHIVRKLRQAIPTIRIKFDSSDRSHSQYVYAYTLSRGVGIKISDHLKEMNPRYIKFITRRRENKEFYLFTVPGYTGFPEFYHLKDIDKLVTDVVEYLNVSSNKQE